MFNIHLQIPAKALLFGEYGVLYEGHALACVLPHLYFEIEIIIESHASLGRATKSSHITVESDFFENGRQDFFLEQQANSTAKPRDDRNVVAKSIFQPLLKPWVKYLKNCKLNIKIKKSFPPDFGFGSSSAIIAGISYALFVFVHNKIPELENEFLWKQIRKSLRNVQGKGSGYDVGVQLASILFPQKTFFIYQNQKNNIIPKITPWILPKNLTKKMGYFVKTNIYSDTKKSLKKFSALSHKQKVYFANEHTKIAEEFLKSPNFSTLKKCMNESLILAKKQGIHIENSLSKQLEEKNIPFKTMGSGHGDCLWVGNTDCKQFTPPILKCDFQTVHNPS